MDRPNWRQCRTSGLLQGDLWFTASRIAKGEDGTHHRAGVVGQLLHEYVLNLMKGLGVFLTLIGLGLAYRKGEEI